MLLSFSVIVASLAVAVSAEFLAFVAELAAAVALLAAVSYTHLTPFCAELFPVSQYIHAIEVKHGISHK